MISPLKFQPQYPSADLSIANIAYSLSLGLPEADFGEKRLVIVANGPSAKDYSFRREPGAPHADTLAINGALSLFTARGLTPTYWAACDPQPLVADFLNDPPFLTTYLVASKCHRSVFERLRAHSVQLWHVNDHPVEGRRQVPCAVSVTLCAMMLAHRLGYRQIDVWGWDLCFGPDGEHHAGQGALGATPDVKDIEVGEGPDALWFKSTATWCCEVNDAVGILPVLKWCGTDVVIHGRSMLGAIIPAYAADVSIFSNHAAH